MGKAIIAQCHHATSLGEGIRTRLREHKCVYATVSRDVWVRTVTEGSDLPGILVVCGQGCSPAAIRSVIGGLGEYIVASRSGYCYVRDGVCVKHSRPFRDCYQALWAYR